MPGLVLPLDVDGNAVVLGEVDASGGIVLPQRFNIFFPPGVVRPHDGLVTTVAPAPNIIKISVNTQVSNSP